MENTILSFSEKTIKERKIIMFVMALMMPIVIICSAFVAGSASGEVDMGSMLFILAIVSAFIVLEIVIVSAIMFKKLRSTKLAITADGIERIGGKTKEFIYYNNILRVQVKRGKDGEISFVKLKTNKKVINISGFDNMEFLLKSLQVNINDVSKLSEKQYKINWNNPGILVLVMVFTAIPLLLLIKFNMDIYQIFNVVFTLILGLFFLLYWPVSRNAGARFKIFETIISALLLISAIFMAMSKIMD